MAKIKYLSLLVVTLLIFSIGCSGGCLDDNLTNRVAKPAFSIDSGTYYDVTISCATEDAVIKYTIDGSDPESSATAVEGTSVTISLFTTVKACASKEGLINSGIAEFTISPERSVRFITYKPDYTLDNYYHENYDTNGSLMTRVKYSGKGTDNRWFTEDDMVSSYCIYQYENGRIVKEVDYTGAGADGKWITADDTAGNYIKYHYESDNLTRKETYNSGDTCLRYTKYEYSGNLISRETVYNDPGADGFWFVGDDDVVDCYYTYSDDGNNLTARNKYIDPGTDTDWFTGDDTPETGSAYQYTGNILYSDQYVYAGDNISRIDRLMNYGSDTLDYTSLFEYTDTTVSKETKYEFDSSTGVDYFYNYIYEGSNLATKEKYSDDTAVKDEYIEYVYTEGKLTRSVTYIKPEPDKKKISWNITISAGVENGGYYTTGGINYDIDGIRIGDYTIDDSDFVKEIKEKVKGIISNTQFSRETGLTVFGSTSGSCVITAYASSSGYVKVRIKFDNFDDGDGIIISGTITKELSGTINLDGSLSGSLDGTFTGTLTITSTNPSWPDSEYLVEYYSGYEYSGDDIIREDVFTDAGADGIWFNADDTMDYSIDYEYASGKLDKKTVKEDYGIFITVTNPDTSVNHYTFQYEVEEE